MTIVYAIIIFCLLIFVHELGHLIAAKSVGVRVNEFSLGMGPRLFKFRRGETEYGLRALPIGGFCAMEGEDENSDDPRAFGKKGFLQKALIIVAGSFMNLLLAVVVLSAVMFSFTGTPTTEVRSVGAGSPAAEAGIAAGDRIETIDGRRMESWEDISEAIKGARGESLELGILRGDESLRVESSFYVDDDGVRKIGVLAKTRKGLAGIPPAVKGGVISTFDMGAGMLEAIAQLITGEVSVKELTGPVGIVVIVGDVAKNGALQLAQLTALISLNLAIMNMLPIPALDGGRLLLLVIRKLTGKAVSDEVEGGIHFVGIMLLFALMIFVTFQDIGRFFVH
ncbi:MAG: RIP metalloprotease RseP [Clostridiales Family XIII bacterium]|jgi:regulator of sigma E protease|nr:RIP metalloprotease RseP [Clostridiales Family XIII bacterium]